MRKGTLEAFIDLTERAETREDLEKAVVRMRDEAGLQNLVYHWVNAQGDQFGAGSYSEDWRDRYVSEQYHRFDPVILAAYQRFHPQDWKKLDWSGKQVRAFQGEAIDAGVGSQGLTIPIRGPNGQFAHFSATLNASDDEWATFADENARQLILLGHYVNQKALEIVQTKEENDKVTLSPREVDALTYLGLGYNRAQAADTLSISEHTLRVYIESARTKLKAQNTTHAVARALAQGLLIL